MKRIVLWWNGLVLVLVCAVAVYAAESTSITDPPNTVMNWLVTAGATIVAVPLVSWLKTALAKWLGEETSGKMNQFVSWAVCYVVAIIGYLIGGAVTGIPVFQVILTSGWAIFASGSAVSILANLVYNLMSSAKTT